MLQTLLASLAITMLNENFYDIFKHRTAINAIKWPHLQAKHISLSFPARRPKWRLHWFALFSCWLAMSWLLLMRKLLVQLTVLEDLSGANWSLVVVHLDNVACIWIMCKFIFLRMRDFLIDIFSEGRSVFFHNEAPRDHLTEVTQLCTLCILTTFPWNINCFIKLVLKRAS